jgi:transposase-like protein
MLKKGHTEEQIIGALKQYESGGKVAEICRKLGVSQATGALCRVASEGRAPGGQGPATAAAHRGYGRGSRRRPKNGDRPIIDEVVF